MNKQAVLVLSLTIAAAMTLQSAHAVVRNGWERPIYRADLTVLEQEGRLPGTLSEAANAKSVEVMTQQDGAASPAGFVLLIDGQSKQAYQVKSTLKDACSSVTYTLVPIQQQTNYRLDAASETIQVVDHSKRHCMDLRAYRWEMNVKNVDLTREILGQVRFAGNPQAVMTPQ